MGRAKSDQQEIEDHWYKKAEIENLRCKVDNEIIDYSDRESFYESGMCSYHRYKKDL